MIDGIYRLTLTNKEGIIDRFPATLCQGELTAWNENFSLSGSVNYYNSEIYIMKSTKNFIPDSVINGCDHYAFEGTTTLHNDGFSIIGKDNLRMVVLAIKEENYFHV